MGLDDRVFELTTVITFPNVRLNELVSFAGRLADAILEVTSDAPAIVAYFVSPDTSTGNIEVGLRFRGADPKHIEGRVVDVLDDAVERLAEQDGTPRQPLEREESALILA